MNHYVEKEYEPYAKQIFGNTSRNDGVFLQKIKLRFPWQKYSQMTARDYVSGAMEKHYFYTSPRICTTKPRRFN